MYKRHSRALKSKKKKVKKVPVVNVYNRIEKKDLLSKYIDALDDVISFDYNYYYKQDDEGEYKLDSKGKRFLNWTGERKLKGLKAQASYLRKKAIAEIARQFFVINEGTASKSIKKAESFLKQLDKTIYQV